MHAVHAQPPHRAAPPQYRAPEGMRLYAIGDIHGHLDLLERLLRLIAEDAHSHPVRQLRLIFLGDFVDRGPHSAQLIDRLIAGPPKSGPLAGAQWVVLRGNHEDIMLRFLAGEEAMGPMWYPSGGRETAQSYLGSQWNDAFGANLDDLRQRLAAAMPAAHHAFLNALPMLHQAGDYAFAHAGIRPGRPLDQQVGDDLMWIRGEFLHDPRPHPCMVVHGHTIAHSPQLLPNRIGIDTGAYRSGHLTAVALEGDSRRFLQT